MAKFAIFKQDPFTINRAQKTWVSFEKLKDIKLESAYIRRISGCLIIRQHDYIVVVSLLLLSTSILLSDSDQRK